MTQEFFCGIDFGTSNSSIAVASFATKPQMIAVEEEHITIPSAIFYEANSPCPVFGRKAMQKYINGEEGRLMRSLKRVLGTDLMQDGTILNGKSVKFENILAQYIKYMKEKAETSINKTIKKVVMGRPVHFRDNDRKGDKEAENQLRYIAQISGFDEIYFQYEPIAAAYAHEEKITGEKLACVIDIGGGTSDFSIIRLGEKLKYKQNRQDDILADSGIRIGGNDFDKDLSMKGFMPELGFKTTYSKKNLYVPSSQYFDMSEWSKINRAYTYQNKKIIKEVLNEAHQPEKYKRLLELYEQEAGHKLLMLVEENKIQLSKQPDAEMILKFLSGIPKIKTTEKMFNQAIQQDLSQIKKAAKECISQAQIEPKKIDIIVLTGGSTEIPYVKNELCKIFPQAEISSENKLTSVGIGLAYDCYHHFKKNWIGGCFLHFHKYIKNGIVI